MRQLNLNLKNNYFAHFRSMVKKWQTLIECHVDVKTTDGYTLRVFCIGFTSKDGSSHRKTCYAQSSQIKVIRKKMNDIIIRDISSSDLKEVVNKLLPDSIAKDIEKSCHGVYPLHDVFIRKVISNFISVSVTASLHLCNFRLCFR
jgi:small subunit ribosomal protein S3Ae